jgi:hypothetical protein
MVRTRAFSLLMRSAATRAIRTNSDLFRCSAT